MQEQSIFVEALEKEDLAERKAFLDRACAGDPVLRQRIERLLRRHQQADSFLEAPAAALAATVNGPIREGPGTRIGPYKLLEQIGEGGMGVVWMAEQQEPVRRLVALKVVKAGMDSAQVIARFEAERQALALMDHPNIAKVLDAGTIGPYEPEASTTDSQGAHHPVAYASGSVGRPYFVMELVKGTPITKYCDEHRLTPRQRLELFVPVCQAIQHAHQKGIIHRDVKPSNVLVAPYDGKPVVKVIDFGVAKATGQRLTERTLFTGFGAVVGTLEYMSPEQAELNNQDIDTRSDIYSLGVLLYELLTGTTPLMNERLKDTPFTEMLRIIREEEPPKPSTRLSTANELPAIAAKRGLEPKKLSALLRGELDWIVMKCLEKDRTHRYETASAFEADVQRYLHEEPVQACPPSAWYRCRKFARRNRRALATGALLSVIALIALGAVVASALWVADQAKARLAVETATKKELERNLYTVRIALAERELANHNPGRAEELLDQCPEELRQWEWGYLKRLCRVSAAILPQGPQLSDGKGFDLAFSPDGRLLAVPSGDKDLTVADASTGEVRILQGHSARVVRLAFSRDGLLASASEDKTVKVWNTTTGQEIWTLRDHLGPVHAVAFSPDGRLMASASEDQKVRVWNATTKALLCTLPASINPNVPVALAFSPDGGRLAASGADTTAIVWDLTSSREVATLCGHTGQVFSVAFSPDGRWLVTAGWEGSVKVWDLTTGALEVRTPQFSVDDVSHAAWSVALSADGRQLAVAGSAVDETVRVYDVQSGKNVFTLRGHSARVVCVAFSPDGRRLASGSLDKTVKLWDTEIGQDVLTLRGHTNLVGHVLFDPSGRRLASGSDDRTVPVRVWDATPLKEDERIRTLRGHAGVVYSVAFSPDGLHLASAGGDRTVRVWEVRTGREILLLCGHTKPVNSVAFSPDGRLASASEDTTVKLWDVRTGAEILTLDKLQGGARCVAFSPDGRRLATSDAAENVRVWDPATGQELLAPLRGHKGYVKFVAFSHDGKLLATGSVDGSVRLWDAATGQPAEKPYQYPTRVMSIALSPDPDSRLLASGDAEKTVTVWETATRKELFRHCEHTNYVTAMAFSRDGQRLASTSWHEVIVWETSTGKNIKILRGLAGVIKGVAFSPDGQRLAACGGYKDKGEIKIWDRTLWDKQADQ